MREEHSNGLLIEWDDPYDGLNRPTGKHITLVDEGPSPGPINPNDPTSYQIPIGGQTYDWTYSYEDDTSRKVTIENPQRNITTEIYKDNLDRPYQTVVDAGPGNLNITETRLYDASGNLKHRTDWDGFITQWEYDGLSRLEKVTHPEVPQDDTPTLVAFTEKYFYAGNDKVKEYVDKNGITFKKTYDNLSRLKTESVIESITGGGGEVTLKAYTYNDTDYTLSIADAENHTTIQRFDQLGRMFEDEDPLGNIFKYEHDGEDKTAEIDRKGHRTEHIYDAVHRVTTTTHVSAGPSNEDLTRVTEYLDEQNLVKETDPNNILTEIKSDALGRKVYMRRSKSSLEVYPEQIAYDENNNPIRVRDAEGNDTCFQYDNADRKTQLIEGCDSPDEATTTYEYDNAQHTVKITDGRVSDPYFSELYEYDALGRKIWSENGELNRTQTFYDGDDKPILIIDPKLNRTTLEYEELGNLMKIITAVGTGKSGEFNYIYNDARNLKARCDAKDNMINYDYDPRNFNTKIYQHRDDSHVDCEYDISCGNYLLTVYGYDANGNLNSILDPKGQVTTHDHNFFNQVEQTTFANQIEQVYPKTLSIAYTYDKNSNIDVVTRTVKPDMVSPPAPYTTDHDYDDLDRLESITDENQIFIEFDWDDAGNRKYIKFDQKTTDYVYDARNRIEEITTDIGGSSVSSQFAYYPDSLLETITSPNGVVSTYTHDKADRIETIAHLSGSSTLSSYSYIYDDNSNLDEMTETHQGLPPETVDYAYDELDRLTTIDYVSPDQGTIYLDYDRVGNRTEYIEIDPNTGLPVEYLEYSYNTLNWLTYVQDYLDPAGDIAYDYDDNGNLVTKAGFYDLPLPDPPLTGYKETTFKHGIRDKLIETEVTVNGQPIPLNLFEQNMDYDFQGRQISFEADIGIIKFSYDGLDRIKQWSGGGNPIFRAYGPEGLFSLYQSGEGQRYAHHASLGSVVNVTDNAAQITETYIYDPFGNFRHGTEQDMLSGMNKLTYTGKFFNPGLALYDYHARHMDPTVSRFISQDPYIGDYTSALTLNRYIYGLSNPLRFYDPDGRTTAGLLTGLGDGISSKTLPPGVAPYDVLRGEEFMRAVALYDTPEEWHMAIHEDYYSGVSRGVPESWNSIIPFYGAYVLVKQGNAEWSRAGALTQFDRDVEAGRAYARGTIDYAEAVGNVWGGYQLTKGVRYGIQAGWRWVKYRGARKSGDDVADEGFRAANEAVETLNDEVAPGRGVYRFPADLSFQE
ncbi:RHS repeat-associated core domain-containing protein [Acidobacteriota bacterium]